MGILICVSGVMRIALICCSDSETDQIQIQMHTLRFSFTPMLKYTQMQIQIHAHTQMRPKFTFHARILDSRPNSDSHAYLMSDWLSCVACAASQESLEGAWRLEVQAAGRWLQGERQCRSLMHAEIRQAHEREVARISRVFIDPGTMARPNKTKQPTHQPTN